MFDHEYGHGPQVGFEGTALPAAGAGDDHQDLVGCLSFVAVAVLCDRRSPLERDLPVGGSGAAVPVEAGVVLSALEVSGGDVLRGPDTSRPKGDADRAGPGPGV